MKRLVISLIALLALGAIRPPGASSGSTLRYDMHRIAFPAGWTSLRPNAINNAGVVAGTGPHASRSVPDPSGVWQTTDLGTLQPGNAGSSQADYVNTAGQVVGASDSNAPLYHQSAILWDPAVGHLQDLNDFLSAADRYDPATGNGWLLEEAFAINDNGQVVGSGDFFANGVDTANFFLLQGLGSGAVTVQALDGTDQFWPRDLNNASPVQVAGRIRLGSASNVTYQAALWTNGTQSPFPGTVDAARIDSTGAVCGAALGSRGFLWTPTGGTLILNPQRTGNPVSNAYALNDALQVVGYANPGSGAKAALWENGSGTVIDLNSITGMPSKWSLYQGRAISSSMKNGTALYIATLGAFGNTSNQGVVLVAR